MGWLLRRDASTPHGPKSIPGRPLVVDMGAAPALKAELLQPLQSSFPDARILVVGRAVADEDLGRLLLLGVRGFIRYDNLPKHLGRAIQAVSEGHLWAKREVLDKLPFYARSMPKPHAPGMPALTPREGIVLSFLQRRLSDKEIASTLGISERTVKFHLGNVYAKLGVHDRHSATDLARAIYYPEVDPTQKSKGRLC